MAGKLSFQANPAPVKPILTVGSPAQGRLQTGSGWLSMLLHIVFGADLFVTWLASPVTHARRR